MRPNSSAEGARFASPITARRTEPWPIIEATFTPNPCPLQVSEEPGEIGYRPPAVPIDDRGDAIEHEVARVGIAVEAAVRQVVGVDMNVDEAGREHSILRVHHLLRRLAGERADCGDHSPAHA